MPKFNVLAEVTISVFTEVEAATAKEAMEIAEGRELPSLCYQCGGSDRAGEEWATSGELDGSPVKMRAEEAD